MFIEGAAGLAFIFGFGAGMGLGASLGWFARAQVSSLRHSDKGREQLFVQVMEEQTQATNRLAEALETIARRRRD